MDWGGPDSSTAPLFWRQWRGGQSWSLTLDAVRLNYEVYAACMDRHQMGIWRWICLCGDGPRWRGGVPAVTRQLEEAPPHLESLRRPRDLGHAS